MRRSQQITIGNTNYKLIKSIGNGGSGVVWEVQSNGSEYAIKFINSDDSGKIARFRKEIDICKTFNHKNIIKCLS